MLRDHTKCSGPRKTNVVCEYQQDMSHDLVLTDNFCKNLRVGFPSKKFYQRMAAFSPISDAFFDENILRHVANSRLPQCKVHPTECTFHSTERSCFLNVLCIQPSIVQCTLHPTIRCSIYFAFILNTKYIHHNVLLDANYIQFDVFCIEGIGALQDFSSKPLQTNWVLFAHQPMVPPVARSIDGIDISLSVANSLVCAILLCGSQFLRVRSSKILTLKMT